MRLRAILIVVAAAAWAVAQPPADKPGAAPAAGPEVKRAESGKSLVVPKALNEAGTIYHTVAGAGKQVSFLSDGKIKSDGHSNGVIGYAVAGPADNPAALRAGTWAMAVKSLETGNKL